MAYFRVASQADKGGARCSLPWVLRRQLVGAAIAQILEIARVERGQKERIQRKTMPERSPAKCGKELLARAEPEAAVIGDENHGAAGATAFRKHFLHRPGDCRCVPERQANNGGTRSA